MSFLSIVVFILVFGLVVLVHELGHFWAARKAGVSVEEFGLGMPPRLWGKKRGETIYSINWIPFGGFVKLAGEGDDADQDPAKSLRAKGFWPRFAVIVAGVVMNFILAYVLIVFGFYLGMPPLAADPATLVTDPSKISQEVRVGAVEANSPADKQGIKPGDVIVSVNNVKISKVVQLQSLIAASRDSVELEIDRFGKTFHVTLVPETQDGKLVAGVYAQELVSKIHYVWWQVPVLAARDFFAATKFIWGGIIGFLIGLIKTGKLSSDVSGPLGIAQITAQAVKIGFLAVLQFTIMLSINLGFVNILPIPALDGGRLLMLIVESIVPKRKWNPRIEMGINSVGFVLLILLIVIVTYRDIVRIFG